VFMVKGSRHNKMEDVVNYFKKINNNQLVE
jgi:hypothetical protein